MNSKKSMCNIVSVGKRRDGGTKYWCLEHKANATAKYGVQAEKCRYADVAPITLEETLIINLEDYPGGVALWGAVPPIYDSTKLPLDRGIHVHARKCKGGKKVIDKTFRRVVLENSEIQSVVSELDAIYYMVSSVFGYSVDFIQCAKCGYPHLDKDWFSVNPHQSHLCAGCGRNFRDSKISIGNPVAKLGGLITSKRTSIKKSKKKLTIKQSEFPGGIQFWGSNPALYWTSNNFQESGIHVHAYQNSVDSPEIDDTFSEVIIDGIRLDETQVRTLMAQLSLPHISERIRALTCPKCNKPHFDEGKNAYIPRVDRHCTYCSSKVVSGERVRKVISNPLLDVLKKLALSSTNPIQRHDLGLLPETL